MLKMKLLASIATAALSLTLINAASAAELQFKQSSFDEAIKHKQSVIVDFSAEWCSICRAQKIVTHALMAEPKMKNVTLFVADYDKEQTLRKSLKVVQQSTLIVFKNGKEVARSIGQTQREELESLFSKAL